MLRQLRNNTVFIMNTNGGKKMLYKSKIAILCLSIVCISNVAFAATDSPDIDVQIRKQQQYLQQLNEQKQNETVSRLNQMEQDLAALNKQVKTFDVQGAIDSLSGQIQALQQQLSKQAEQHKTVLDEIKALKDRPKEVSPEGLQPVSTEGTAQYLINPGPTAKGFMQDGVNAQNDSRMVFSYGSNQIYKIYCKVGFLTDLQFQKGEKITFVGGGDTASWKFDTTESSDFTHLYITPNHASANTNLIINTNKHSYQINIVAAEWYNPMVTWSYSSEVQLANILQQKKEEQLYTGTLQSASIDQLNFSYSLKGKADWAPEMIFDDGEKTYIKFGKMPKKMPILFIREAGKKDLSLVNYRIKDSCYIVDTVFDQAELRVSDREKITITAKK